MTLKKGTRTSNFQSNELPLKIVQLPLSYDVPLKKIIIKHWSRMTFTVGNPIALPLIFLTIPKPFKKVRKLLILLFAYVFNNSIELEMSLSKTSVFSFPDIGVVDAIVH